MRTHYLSILLVGILAGVLPNRSGAQSKDLHFVRVIEEAGLGNWTVTSVAQDQQGYMWVGGWSGLMKYDGHSFRTYRSQSTDSTTRGGGPVESLLVDREGVVWIGGYGGRNAGIDSYDPETDTFTRYRHRADDPTGIGEGRVSWIYEDSEGYLWIGFADTGVDRFDRRSGTFRHFQHDPEDSTSLSSNIVRAIYEDSRGNVWIGTGDPWTSGPRGGGLNRFIPQSGTFHRYKHDPNDESSLIDGRVQAIHEDSRGNLWIGTWGDGLHKYDRDRDAFIRMTYDPQKPERPHSSRLQNQLAVNDPVGSGVTAIHEDASGTLWVGTFLGGINRFDRTSGSWSHHEHDPTDPHTLDDNRVFRISESRDGSIWIATWGGLNKVAPTAALFENHEHDPGDPNGLGPYVVTELHEDRAGNLWVGTNSGGLHRLIPASKTFLRYPIPPFGLAYTVTTIHDDGTGAIVFMRGDYHVYRMTPDESTPEVIAVLSEFDGDELGRGPWVVYPESTNLWWLSLGDGLIRVDFENRTLERFRHDETVEDSRLLDMITVIDKDRHGVLWLATAGGLSSFDRSTGSFEPVWTDAPVDHLHEDEAGRFWVATFSKGLMLFDRDTHDRTYFTEDDGLTDNRVSSVISDEDSVLWIGTFSGMSRMNPRTGRFRQFHTTDGLQSNDIRYPTYRTEKGTLYFGVAGGLTAVYPEAASIGGTAPDVHLTDVTVSESGQTATRFDAAALLRRSAPLNLTHDQHDFTISYVALHYTNPSKNEYAYRLEGYEEAWRYVGSQRRATYTNLNPGDYTFRVKAAGSEGVWNEGGAAVRLVILPPWWRTDWAYAIYALFLLAAVGFAAVAQRRYVQRRERERARDRELAQAREIEAMNERLRAHEAQLEAQNAALETQKTQLEEQKQRLVELDAHKSRFFANISHEFRTPLTLLLGPLRDALLGQIEAGRLERHVPMMHRNAQRLLALINQLLDLSNLEAGVMQLQPRRLELVDFLREIVLAFSARAEREGVALSFSPDEESVPASFDADKLEKVVANLLSNAFKFTPSGGKIRVGVAVEDDVIEITVKDTGRGIPTDELPRIFDRFYQVDGSTVREHEGTGIGLALTKELVELHDGSISVESEVGFGTSFTIRMPIIADDGEPLETVEQSAGRMQAGDLHAQDGLAPTDAHSAPGDAPTVLVVDDNPDMRTYLQSLLADRYRVLQAEDGEEGLVVATQAHPDLVLADVMMPRKDGYSLCRDLKSDPDLGHIPVVLLTAKADLDSKLEGLETGADDYLAKPFSAEEVLARMENLIDLRTRLRERFRGEVRLGPSEIDVASEAASFVEEVRDVIEANMGESAFGVDDLADAVGLSARQLQRRLREAADLSAAAYIRMMRLQRAAQLLEQDAGLVSEVAYRIGFKNADHFSRLFRQVFGVPPSEYCGNAVLKKQAAKVDRRFDD